MADSPTEIDAIDPKMIERLSYQLLCPPETLPPIYPKLPPPPPEPLASPLVIPTPILYKDVEIPTDDSKPPQKLSLRERFSKLGQTIDNLIPEFTGFDGVTEKISSIPPFTKTTPTAPPAQATDPLSIAPVAIPATSVGLFQKISSHYPVMSLYRDGVSFADYEAANLKLSDFRRAGYTLAEVKSIIPQYEMFLRLGLDKSLFDTEKWKVREAAALWEQSMRTICTHSCFLAMDLLRCDFSLSTIKSMGYNLSDLIQMGAQFEFINTLGASPYQLTKTLGATRTDLRNLRLTVDQKKFLMEQKGWTPNSMVGCFGMTPAQIKQDWGAITVIGHKL